MPGVCILTDSTAQFPVPVFPGQHLVNLIPLSIQIGGVNYLDGKDLKIGDLPLSALDSSAPIALSPSPAEFRQAFLSLSYQYDEIIAVLLSGHLSQAVHNARSACANPVGPAPVTIIDSQTASVGLGLLVQAAAEAADQGGTGAEIRCLLRELVGHTYTLFCLQSLTYLFQVGHLLPAQSIIGQMLGLTALFVLENGLLVPVQKARNVRQLVDLLHEFVLEFDELKHIALLRGLIPFDYEARTLRERICTDFPATPYSEHALGTALAAILGPHSLGLVAMDG